jgi:hypothetical protein
MKNMLIFLLLTAAAFAQSPVSVTVTKNSLTYTNTSTKDIVLVIGSETYSHGDVTPFGMDSIDNAQAFQAGATHSMSFPDEDPAATAKVTFVQFADGTTWGDSTTKEAQFAKNKRQAKLSFLSALSNTANTDDFVAQLGKMPQNSGAANFVRQQITSVGADLARQHVLKRYSIAQTRQNLWAF